MGNKARSKKAPSKGKGNGSKKKIASTTETPAKPPPRQTRESRRKEKVYDDDSSVSSDEDLERNEDEDEDDESCLSPSPNARSGTTTSPRTATATTAMAVVASGRTTNETTTPTRGAAAANAFEARFQHMENLLERFFQAQGRQLPCQVVPRTVSAARSACSPGNTTITNSNRSMDKQEQILVMKLPQNQDAIKKGLYAFVKLHTFRRIKFPTTEEKGVRECTKAVQKSYVLLPEGVDTDVFASEWQSSLRERLRMLRNNCQNSAKKKFISDWKEGVVPQNLEASLVTNYRDYADDDGKVRDNRKDNYDSFLYFIDRILPSVNADVTKYYGDARCQFGLSNAFTVTDEAFGLLMVENYVERWKALAKEWPSSDTTEDQGLKRKRMRSLGGRYTGSEKGMVAGGWDNGGINRFNELAQMVSTARKKLVETRKLENIIMNHWRGLEGDSEQRRKKAKQHIVTAYEDEDE
ncbi:unnamed protein product [Cylindrotheca closterium]|uniref:Uncharacterized protein n=1 Tax=Cylindrotheca closterium TaxID=2856 RepID=A0AAD2FJ67_9STRA|nr:unnamed protein product [Cylindrotheca closterium]CAJ1935149.1 unnamed protein product [Cylindrotheca closterium]CAJ1957403.1 unnamed protein product [Cylindrotheca closterium]